MFLQAGNGRNVLDVTASQFTDEVPDVYVSDSPGGAFHLADGRIFLGETDIRTELSRWGTEHSLKTHFIWDAKVDELASRLAA